MRRQLQSLATLLLTLSLTTSPAHALTISIPVTPDSLKQDPQNKLFKVTVEKRPDGLLHFSITFNLPRPAYIVSTFTTTDSATQKPLATTTSAAVIRDDSASYYFAISPERASTAQFELATYSFAESGGHPTPEPGGTQYQFNIPDFAKLATETPAPKTP